MINRKPLWHTTEDGQTLIVTKAVVVNRHPALLEIHFNRVTKIGWYEVRLVRSGYTAIRDGGLEWDALARVLRKYAWMAGRRVGGMTCHWCGGSLWRLPYRNRRKTQEGTITFAVYVCVKEDCLATWEGEFCKG